MTAPDVALTIVQAYPYFPVDTVHLVVVDPGVGSTRRPLLVTTGKQMFIAPDNGVLSFVYEREERVSVRHISASHYFLQPVSSTFHGRDVFAAVAGWLSKGVEVAKFGDEITDYIRFAAPKPKPVNDKLLKGVILKVDKFGNLVTNITPHDVPQLCAPEPPPFKVRIEFFTFFVPHQLHIANRAGVVQKKKKCSGRGCRRSRRGSAPRSGADWRSTRIVRRSACPGCNSRIAARAPRRSCPAGR